MRQALRLATRGAGSVAPNPLVGAVIVKASQIIGRGYHRRFGGPHAEVEAIEDCKKAGHDSRGATMFVTLEPCCHHGKTAPCTEAIARAAIAHVEIATLDDCQLVAGKGARWLTEHGIEVTVGCCEREARRLNAGFFKLQKTGMPQVILKWAQSLDGKLAWPEQAQPRWITNEKSRRHVHRLRSHCGAIMVGIGTVLADDPLLNVRLPRKMPQPIRVVLDSKLRLPVNAQVVETAQRQPVLLATLRETLDSHTHLVQQLERLGCTVKGFSQFDGRVSLPEVLHELARRGVTDVLVEGGPTLLQAFWNQDLADKLMIYTAPTIIAAGAAPTISFAESLERLQDVRITQFEGDVLLEGYVKTY